jgi:2-polyprenyl-3-methyl-5-hydroxy-6-metoxy-1,4-benzoquinol methylase
MNSYSHDQIPADGFFAGGPCLQENYTVLKRIQFLDQHLDSTRGSRVLDVGSGYGAYLRYMLSKASEVVGVDINAEYVRRQRNAFDESTLLFAVMDGCRLGFRNCHFDNVVAIEVMEHIPDDRAFISEVFRVLKPGGQFILSVPNKTFFFETHPIRVRSRLIGSRWGTGIPLLPLLPAVMRKHFATVHLYTKRKLTSMLSETGFKIELVSYLMPNLDSLESKTLEHGQKESIFTKIRRLLERLENSPLRSFGSTIILSAEKPKQ